MNPDDVLGEFWRWWKVWLTVPAIWDYGTHTEKLIGAPTTVIRTKKGA